MTMTKKESRIAAQKLIAALKSDLSYMVEGSSPVVKEAFNILVEGQQLGLEKILWALSQGEPDSLDKEQLRREYYYATEARISTLWSESASPCTHSEFQDTVEALRTFIHRTVTRPRPR